MSNESSDSDYEDLNLNALSITGDTRAVELLKKYRDMQLGKLSSPKQTLIDEISKVVVESPKGSLFNSVLSLSTYAHERYRSGLPLIVFSFLFCFRGSCTF